MGSPEGAPSIIDCGLPPPRKEAIPLNLPDGSTVRGDLIVAYPLMSAAATEGNVLHVLSLRATGIEEIELVGECLNRSTPAGPAELAPDKKY